jgi:hypothetical protein
MSARKITKRTIALELKFDGPGKVIQTRPNAFSGGVVAPALAGKLDFELCPEVVDEDGLLNPPDNASAFEGAFQINVAGTAAGYRELARYLLGLAELDTSVDAGFHEHHEALSGDGQVHLHLILRKLPD